jgi:hypothetical protein
MTRPTLPSGLQRGISFTIPDYWTPEQALAVFELLDDLRQVVADHYLPQIQTLLREQRHTNPDYHGETHAPCSGDAF